MCWKRAYCQRLLSPRGQACPARVEYPFVAVPHAEDIRHEIGSRQAEGVVFKYCPSSPEQCAVFPYWRSLFLFFNQQNNCSGWFFIMSTETIVIVNQFFSLKWECVKNLIQDTVYAMTFTLYLCPIYINS